MRRVGYMCVALSALFVLDSHGAGIADWNDSARQCLERYVKAGVTASDADVKDTQRRWKDCCETRGTESFELIVSDNGSCGLQVGGGYLALYRAGESLGAISRLDHDNSLPDGTNLRWDVTESNGWKHVTLKLSREGNAVGRVAFDLYNDSTDERKNIVVLSEVNLPGYTFGCKGNNINLLDNNVNCKELTIAALNSAVCVSNNIGKIGDFKLFTHNGVIADIPGFADLRQVEPEAKELPESEGVFRFTDRVISPAAPRNASELFGRFIQKCPTWLSNGLSKNKTISIFGLDAADKHVESEDVKINLIGNIKVKSMTNRKGSDLVFGNGFGTEFANLGLYLNPWSSYNYVVDGNSINLTGFADNGVLNGLHNMFVKLYDKYNSAKPTIYLKSNVGDFEIMKSWLNRTWVYYDISKMNSETFFLNIFDIGNFDGENRYKFESSNGQSLSLDQARAESKGKVTLDPAAIDQQENQKLSFQRQPVRNFDAIEYEKDINNNNFGKMSGYQKKNFSNPADIYYYEFFYAKDDEASKPCSWAVDFMLSYWMRMRHTPQEISKILNQRQTNSAPVPGRASGNEEKDERNRPNIPAGTMMKH